MGFACLLLAEDITPRFAPGITISYTPPSAKVWRVAERFEQEEIGMIMYKRDVIVDENGVSVEPCLSIVYRRVPDEVKDPMEFFVASRMNIHYEITGITDIEGRALVLSYKYPVEGYEHMVSIAHLFEVGLGVQVISETTTTVFKDIEADQTAFLRSVSLKKK